MARPFQSGKVTGQAEAERRRANERYRAYRMRRAQSEQRDLIKQEEIKEQLSVDDWRRSITAKLSNEEGLDDRFAKAMKAVSGFVAEAGKDLQAATLTDLQTKVIGQAVADEVPIPEDMYKKVEKRIADEIERQAKNLITKPSKDLLKKDLSEETLTQDEIEDIRRDPAKYAKAAYSVPRQMGKTTEAFRSLVDVAKNAGVSFEELAAVMSKFNPTFRKLEEESIPYYREIFKRLYEEGGESAFTSMYTNIPNEESKADSLTMENLLGTIKKFEKFTQARNQRNPFDGFLPGETIKGSLSQRTAVVGPAPGQMERDPEIEKILNERLESMKEDYKKKLSDLYGKLGMKEDSAPKKSKPKIDLKKLTRNIDL